MLVQIVPLLVVSQLSILEAWPLCWVEGNDDHTRQWWSSHPCGEWHDLSTKQFIPTEYKSLCISKLLQIISNICICVTTVLTHGNHSSHSHDVLCITCGSENLVEGRGWLSGSLLTIGHCSNSNCHLSKSLVLGRKFSEFARKFNNIELNQ